ncbi:unnamed protein product, partial [Didymodactylos carnosus]
GSEKYTFRAALFIHGCQTEELRSTKREFPFILRDTQQKRDYKFVAKSEEKRTEWLKHLRDAICSNSELSENEHCFQMKSFDEPSPRCDFCNRYLCFDRGSIELPRAFSNGSNMHHNRVYALYDYDGTSDGNKVNFNRQSEHFLSVAEGDELEVLEDDDERLWKVKNVHSNEVGLIPATLVGSFINGEAQKSSQSPLVCDCDTWFIDLSRQQAETLLKNENIPDNTFLIRKQGKNDGNAISIKHNNEIYHIRIYTLTQDRCIKYYLVDTIQFSSLQALVEYYRMNSLEDRFPPVKSTLGRSIAQVYEINSNI